MAGNAVLCISGNVLQTSREGSPPHLRECERRGLTYDIWDPPAHNPFHSDPCGRAAGVQSERGNETQRQSVEGGREARKREMERGRWIGKWIRDIYTLFLTQRG